MPGYFDDGTIDVRLGAYAFVTPAEVRRNVVLEPHAAPAVVLDSGGGVQELAVTCQAVRANLGDAERWIYGLLRALALSDPGELGFTDSLGNLAVFGDSVCVGARGEVRALSFADVQMDWLTPAKSGEVAAPHALPALPATYAGTSTALDYAAGGVAIGTHPVGMRIDMVRQYPLREVPRARGARTRGPERGALMRFMVTSHAVAGAAQHLADYLADLARAIGPRAVDLTGNGNTFEDVLLERLRPSHTDRRHTEFEAEFLLELAPVALTTTPAPYPTTTVLPTTTTQPATTTTTQAATTTTTPLACDVEDAFGYVEDPLATFWEMPYWVFDEAHATGSRARQDRSASGSSRSVCFHKTGVGSNDQDVHAPFYTNASGAQVWGYVAARVADKTSFDNFYWFRVDFGVNDPGDGRQLEKRVGAVTTTIAQMDGPGVQTEWHLRIVVDDDDLSFNLRAYDRPDAVSGWTERLQANDSDLASGDYCGFELFIGSGAGEGKWVEADDFCAIAL